MKTLKTILTLLLGVGSGMAIGYLTAPTSGRKTRKKLAKDAEEYMHQLEAKANESLEEAKTVLNETISTRFNRDKTNPENV